MKLRNACQSAVAVVAVAIAPAAPLRAQGDTEVHEFRIATLAPEDSGWMREMRAGSSLIEEMTEGRVTFRFRAGGIAGTGDQVLRRIRSGDYQGGAFTAGELSPVYAGLNTYGIPLMFRSLEEVNFVRLRLDGKIAAGLEEAGFVSFGFGEGGFSLLMSSKPVSHIDDLRREKIWVPRGDAIAYEVLQAFRLSPVPLDLSDALLGLRTSLVDVVAASPYAAVVLQWHTEIEYITDLPLSYSMGLFAIASDDFYALEAGDQEIVRTVIADVMARIDQAAINDNQNALDRMLSQGIELVAVNDEDVEDWRNLIEAQYDSLRRRRDIDTELFDEMLGLLETFRSDN